MIFLPVDFKDIFVLKNKWEATVVTFIKPLLKHGNYLAMICKTEISTIYDSPLTDSSMSVLNFFGNFGDLQKAINEWVDGSRKFTEDSRNHVDIRGHQLHVS